jgi:hypothetical protein
MKKLEICFRPQGRSGPLSVYWHDGPYGDAIESENGIGVGWFSPDGCLLGVEFDDVERDADIQELKFKKGLVISLAILRGKISVKVKKSRLKMRKSLSHRVA